MASALAESPSVRMSVQEPERAVPASLASSSLGMPVRREILAPGGRFFYGWGWRESTVMFDLVYLFFFKEYVATREAFFLRKNCLKSRKQKHRPNEKRKKKSVGQR